MRFSLAWLQWPLQLQPRQTDKVSTIDMEMIILRFYHIIQMITTHSTIHLVCCCHGQMSLIAVSYPVIFIHVHSFAKQNSTIILYHILHATHSKSGPLTHKLNGNSIFSPTIGVFTFRKYGRILKWSCLLY